MKKGKKGFKLKMKIRKMTIMICALLLIVLVSYAIGTFISKAITNISWNF